MELINGQFSTLFYNFKLFSVQNVKLLLNHVNDGPGYGCLVHSTNLFYREIAGLILFASNSNPVGLNSYKDWGCCQFEKKKNCKGVMALRYGIQKRECSIVEDGKRPVAIVAEACHSTIFVLGHGSIRTYAIHNNANRERTSCFHHWKFNPSVGPLEQTSL